MGEVTDYAGSIVLGEEIPVGKQQRQVAVTLSEGAFHDFSVIAAAVEMPLASLLKLYLEERHQNPITGSMLKRAEIAIKGRKSDLTDKQVKLLEEAGYEIDL